MFKKAFLGLLCTAFFFGGCTSSSETPTPSPSESSITIKTGGTEVKVGENGFVNVATDVGVVDVSGTAGTSPSESSVPNVEIIVP